MQATAGISIEFISVFGLHPVDYVKLAAGLGCGAIGISLAPSGENPHGYPLWSLREDKALRREFRAALDDLNISLSIGEGFLAWPEAPASSLIPDLDIMAELGVPIANIASLDPDFGRTCNTLAEFTEAACARGLGATLEFLPGLPIEDIPSAVAVLRRIQHPGMRLLIDAMHIFRSGGTVEDLAALEPADIGYLQICDVPMPAGSLSYHDEARYERKVPGEGDLPLLDLLRILPDGLVVGIEVPMLSLAREGIGPKERLGRCVEATRGLLSLLPGANPDLR